MGLGPGLRSFGTLARSARRMTKKRPMRVAGKNAVIDEVQCLAVLHTQQLGRLFDVDDIAWLRHPQIVSAKKSNAIIRLHALAISAIKRNDYARLFGMSDTTKRPRDARNIRGHGPTYQRGES